MTMGRGAGNFQDQFRFCQAELGTCRHSSAAAIDRAEAHVADREIVHALERGSVYSPGEGKQDKMKIRIAAVLRVALAVTVAGVTLTLTQQSGTAQSGSPSRPQGPCDIYAAAGDP